MRRHTFGSVRLKLQLTLCFLLSLINLTCIVGPVLCRDFSISWFIHKRHLGICFSFFFFNDPAPTDISPLPLPAPLPILVNRLTAACPTVAVHVLWDFKPGSDPKETSRIAKKHGVKIGAINPNVFQDQAYKLGSFCSPSDRKSTRLNSSHLVISYAVFCLK